MRRLTYLMVASQTLDGLTFLLAASVLGLEGEIGPLAVFGEPAAIVTIKALSIAWLLLMVRATLAKQARVLAVIVLAVGAAVGWLGALSNLAALGGSS